MQCYTQMQCDGTDCKCWRKYLTHKIIIGVAFTKSDINNNYCRINLGVDTHNHSTPTTERNAKQVKEVLVLFTQDRLRTREAASSEYTPGA